MIDRHCLVYTFKSIKDIKLFLKVIIGEVLSSWCYFLPNVYRSATFLFLYGFVILNVSVLSRKRDSFFWKRYLKTRMNMSIKHFLCIIKETIFWRAVLNVLPKRIALELIYVTEEFVVYGILHFHPAFWWRMQANYASDTSRYVRFINIWNVYHFNVWFICIVSICISLVMFQISVY